MPSPEENEINGINGVNASNTANAVSFSVADALVHDQLIKEALEITGLDEAVLRSLSTQQLSQVVTTLRGRFAKLSEAPHITICSMVPWELRSPTFSHAGRIKINGVEQYRLLQMRYDIPCCVDFQPQYVKVYDTFTMIMDVHWDDSNFAPSQVRRDIPAISIVDNLLQFWAGDHYANAAGHRIGVGVIRGDVATDEEKAALRAQMRAFLQFQVERAAQFNLNERTKILIGPEHHRAFRELTKYPEIRIDISRYPWARTGQEIEETIQCLWCAGKINPDAIRCQHCNGNQLDFYEKYGGAPGLGTRLRDIWERVIAASGVGSGVGSGAEVFNPSLPSPPPLSPPPATKPKPAATVAAK
jgi:hypothetical protein